MYLFIYLPITAHPIHFQAAWKLKVLGTISINSLTKGHAKKMSQKGYCENLYPLYSPPPPSSANTLPVDCWTPAVVGSVFSLADRDTNSAKGTNHRHIVK